MKATTGCLLAAALTFTTATSADAQVRFGDSRLTISRAERNRLVHFNAKQGILEIGIATDLPKTVDRSERRALDGIVRDLKAGKTKEATERWSRFAGDYAKKISRAEDRRASTTDLNMLMQWVLRESYLENNKDPQFFAEKVKFCNDLKKFIRKEITRMREALSDMKADAGVLVRKIKVGQKYVEGKDSVTFGSATLLSSKELDSYIKDLDNELEPVGDDAELANIDPLNALQRQQQTLQTMSAVSKMLHDTSIIRKIG